VSVVNVKLNWSGQQAEGTPQSKAYTQIYTVLVNNPAQDDVETARTAPGIPPLGTPLGIDVTRTVESITAVRTSLTLYTVTVVYRSSVGEGEDAEGVDIDWDAAPSSEEIDEDIDGKPIRNSAGEPFDPRLTEEIYDLQLTVTRTQANFEHRDALDYLGGGKFGGCVNADPFYGYAPGSARMRSIRATRRRAGRGYDYRVGYVIQFRDSWRRRVLDQGYTVKAAVWGDASPLGDLDRYAARLIAERGYTYEEAVAETERLANTPVLVEAAEAAHQPILLDGAGKPLKAGQPAVWLSFTTNRSRPFGPLGLEY